MDFTMLILLVVYLWHTVISDSPTSRKGHADPTSHIVSPTLSIQLDSEPNHCVIGQYTMSHLLQGLFLGRPFQILPDSQAYI